MNILIIFFQEIHTFISSFLDNVRGNIHHCHQNQLARENWKKSINYAFYTIGKSSAVLVVCDDIYLFNYSLGMQGSEI